MFAVIQKESWSDKELAGGPETVNGVDSVWCPNQAAARHIHLRHPEIDFFLAGTDGSKVQRHHHKVSGHELLSYRDKRRRKGTERSDRLFKLSQMAGRWEMFISPVLFFYPSLQKLVSGIPSEKAHAVTEMLQKYSVRPLSCAWKAQAERRRGKSWHFSRRRLPGEPRAGEAARCFASSTPLPGRLSAPLIWLATD